MVLLAGLAASVGLAALPRDVVADNPQGGSILVLDDHALPGGSMTVAGTGLDDSFGPLQLTLEAGGTRVSLGLTSAIAGGSMSASVVVPSDFPTGYALLTAATRDGSRTWSTYVLIGERAEGPDALGPGGAVVDLSAVGIAMIAIGLIVISAAGAWFLRGRLRSGR